MPPGTAAAPPPPGPAFPPQSEAREPHSRRGFPIVLTIAVLLILGSIAATFMTGGFAEAKEATATLRPGQTLDQGWFDTQVVGARHRVEKTTFGGKVTGQKAFLEISFKVTNKHTETTKVGSPPHGRNRGNAFAESIISVFPKPRVVRTSPSAFIDDHTAIAGSTTMGSEPSRQLHPKMTEAVTVQYPVDPKVPPPDKLDLRLGAFEWRSDYFGAGARWWLRTEEPSVAEKIQGEVVGPPLPVAAVTMPVKRDAS